MFARKIIHFFFLNGLTIDEQKDISIDGKVFTPLSIIVYILILAPGRKTILYRLQLSYFFKSISSRRLVD